MEAQSRRYMYMYVIFSFFTLYSLLLLSFFLYLKSVPIYVIVHVWLQSHITLLFAVDESHSQTWLERDSGNETSFLGAVELTFFYYSLFHRRSMLFDL